MTQANNTLETLEPSNEGGKAIRQSATIDLTEVGEAIAKKTKKGTAKKATKAKATKETKTTKGKARRRTAQTKKKHYTEDSIRL